jgi:hypothetical protein
LDTEGVFVNAFDISVRVCWLEEDYYQQEELTVQNDHYQPHIIEIAKESCIAEVEPTTRLEEHDRMRNEENEQQQSHVLKLQFSQRRKETILKQVAV